MSIKQGIGRTSPHLWGVCLALALLFVACDSKENPFLKAPDTPTPQASSGASGETPTAAPTRTTEERIAASETAEEAYLQQQLVPTKGVIRFGNTTDSKAVQLENAIAGYIIVYGYDYAVELTDMTPEEQQAALLAGELDVLMEVAKNESEDWYTKSIESGMITDIGSVREADPNIRIAVAASLEPRAPEVVAFLRKISFGDALLDDLTSKMSGGRTGVRPIVAALIYLKNNEDAWTQWITGDVINGVKAAIEEGKTTLVNRQCVNTGGYGSGLMCN